MHKIFFFVFLLHLLISFKHSQLQNSKDIENLGMIFVEGGEFNMGDQGGSSGQELHRVSLSSFYIDKYEVTVTEFAKFINATGYKTDAEKNGFSNVFIRNKSKNEKIFSKKGVNWQYNSNGKLREKSEWNFPVVHVSWNDAYTYAKWKGKRLPTEAEWEYAAKGGRKSKNYIYSGSNNINLIAWYRGNSKLKTHEVGTKDPNELGIYDMMGNVSEWCNDLYGEDYYLKSDKNNPQGPDKSTHGQYRIIRGISYRIVAYPIWSRHCGNPAQTNENLGFRCAK